MSDKTPQDEVDYDGGKVWCDHAESVFGDPIECSDLSEWSHGVREAVPVNGTPWRFGDAILALYSEELESMECSADAFVAHIPKAEREAVEAAVNALLAKHGPYFWRPGRKLSFASVKEWIQTKSPGLAYELWGGEIDR